MTPTVATKIERFLRTGDADSYYSYSAWPSDSFFERATLARDDLRGALAAEVLRRSEGGTFPHLPGPDQTIALTRRKTQPIVRGLFPRAEQGSVFALVERSVVFLSPATVGGVIREQRPRTGGRRP